MNVWEFLDRLTTKIFDNFLLVIALIVTVLILFTQALK